MPTGAEVVIAGKAGMVAVRRRLHYLHFVRHRDFYGPVLGLVLLAILTEGAPNLLPALPFGLSMADVLATFLLLMVIAAVFVRVLAVWKAWMLEKDLGGLARQAEVVMAWFDKVYYDSTTGFDKIMRAAMTARDKEIVALTEKTPSIAADAKKAQDDVSLTWMPTDHERMGLRRAEMAQAIRKCRNDRTKPSMVAMLATVARLTNEAAQSVRRGEAFLERHAHIRDSIEEYKTWKALVGQLQFLIAQMEPAFTEYGVRRGDSFTPK